MKKMTALLMAAMMMVSMAACSAKEDKNTADSNGSAANPQQSTQDAKTEESKEEGLQLVTEGKLIMSTDAGFAPYEYMEGDQIVGIDVDIAQYIADELGLELEIMDVDFTNALLAPQQGKSDFAAAGISVTEERKESMDFSIEYASSKKVVVVKKGNTSITDEDTMVTKTIGVQQGTTADIVYGDTEAYPDTKVQSYKKYLVAADDLKNGKIDCIVMDNLPAEMIVKQNPELEVLDMELFTDKYAFAMQKGNQALLDKINPILEELIESGKIDEFTKKHMETAM